MLSTRVELLSSEQDMLVADLDFPEKLYFFSSICLDIVKHVSTTLRDKYVEAHMRAAANVRYIHFPMCYKSH